MNSFFILYLSLIYGICEFRKVFENPQPLSIHDFYPKKYFLNRKKYYCEAVMKDDSCVSLEICKNCIKRLICSTKIEKILKSCSKFVFSDNSALLCTGLENYYNNGLILLSNGKESYFLGVENNQLVLFYNEYSHFSGSKHVIVHDELTCKDLNSVTNLNHFNIVPLENCLFASTFFTLLEKQKNSGVIHYPYEFDLDHEVESFNLSEATIKFTQIKGENDKKSDITSSSKLESDEYTFETKF